jgi:hypothetical protein
MTTEEFYDTLIEHLNDKKALLHLRVGDGEAKFLNFPINSYESKFVQTKQINKLLNTFEFEDSKKKLSDAICRADILGTPNSNEETKSDWIYVPIVLNELKKRNDWTCEKYCNMWINRHLLERKLLHKLLLKINSLVIISGRDVKDALLEKYKNIENIEYYLIPPEQNYEKEVDKNISINTLKVLDEIATDLKKEDRRGQLLLYGTGVFGKYLAQVFTEAGGVSLDLGSVFDILAGRAHRGWSINLLSKHRLI